MKIRSSILLACLLVSGLVFAPITSADNHKEMKGWSYVDSDMMMMLEEKVAMLSDERVDTILSRLETAKVRFEKLHDIYEVLIVIEELIKQKQADMSIAWIATSSDDFSILVQAVAALDLVETLDTEWPFTVFAPTNTAFENILAELNITAEELLANDTMLQSIVTYHVVPGTVSAHDVTTVDHGTLVETLQWESLRVNNLNGVVVDGSTVTTADIFATNGVVHIVDEVLLPPTVREMLGMDTDRGSADIVETAVSSELFPTLVAAVQAAELVDVLKADGPYTVFAPTEEAFAALLADLWVTAEELLGNTELLTSVLTYHIIPGRYVATDVVGLSGPTMLSTLNGETVTVDPQNGAPVINDANIVQTDIFTTNGVIHVIDEVLLP